MATLIQIDSTGTHELGSGVQSADTAFGPSGQVLDVVGPDGTLTQIDAAGPHVLLTGVQSADTRSWAIGRNPNAESRCLRVERASRRSLSPAGYTSS